jgi:hypothetical protein
MNGTHGQATGWLLNFDDDYLGFSRSFLDVLDVVVKVIGG